MIHGFVPGSRASLTTDLVATALLVVLPVLTWSIWQVRRHSAYGRHKRAQIALSIALAVVVLLFEIDVRLNGWTDLARPSPYYDTWLFPWLYLHLTLAITTTGLWIATVTHALRRLPKPPGPSPASATHKILGRLAALGIYATALTGWTFFWAAFIA